MPILSIVAPVFNEEEVLPVFHRELMNVLDQIRYEYELEIIYVDDGSRDATPILLKAMAEQDSQVRYVIFSRNFGHQAALTAGLEHCRGDVIISMDSDLQHPPSLIPKLLEEWKAGNEIVLTLRDDHQSLGRFKRLTSRLFYVLMKYCSGMEIRPAASDFRLMNRNALNALLQMPERNRFIRGMVHWLGFTTSEVKFLAPPRFAGKSKFTLVRMIRLARDGLLSFSRIPLHAALIFAGAMIGLSFVASVISWFVLRQEGAASWGLLTLIFSGHLVAGGLWIAMMAFSEYLARIHEQVLARPLFVVQSRSSQFAEEEQVSNSTVTPSRQRKAA